MNTVIVIRGSPGSGKSHLARSLAGAGEIVSIDDYMHPPQGEDIFESGEVASASAMVLDEVRRRTAAHEPSIVVEIIGVRLFEIRDIRRVAASHGYDVKVIEPETSWARAPAQCQQRTKFPLSPPTWHGLVVNWEGPATPERIDSSASPGERIVNAKWIAVLSDDARDPGQGDALLHFLLRNFSEEVQVLTGTGFFGSMGRRAREAFRRKVSLDGMKPPRIMGMNTPPGAADRVSETLLRHPANESLARSI